MRARVRKLAPVVGLFLGGGYLLAGIGNGCATYVGESLMTATDFCFIFDCQNGMLGGTVKPCAGVGDGSGQQPLFRDCPDFGGP